MNNAESTIGPDDHRLPNGGTMKKKDVFNWQEVGVRPRQVMLDKSVLKIDHDYQRDHVSEVQVNNIAREWNWGILGALSVGARPDGSLWVFDGQHRLLAALKRYDIVTLPCNVYPSKGKEDEAALYLKINGNRARVAAIDTFRAKLASNDPIAKLVDGMLSADGYRVSRGNAKGNIRCIGAIVHAMTVDQMSAHAAWEAAVAIFSGEPVLEPVFRGLFEADKYLRKHGRDTVDAAQNIAKLVKCGADEILRQIANQKAIRRSGGSKPAAEAIISVLNFRRVCNRIPSMYAEA